MKNDKIPQPTSKSGLDDTWGFGGQDLLPTFSYNSDKGGSIVWPEHIWEVLKKYPKRLRVLQPLPQSLGVYIPKIHVNATQHRNELMEILSTFGGGATCSSTIGICTNKSGNFVSEESWIVWSWIDPTLMPSALEATLQFTERLKVALSKEAVLLEVNRRLVLDLALAK
jgi:hypothetical protein